MTITPTFRCGQAVPPCAFVILWERHDRREKARERSGHELLQNPPVPSFMRPRARRRSEPVISRRDLRTSDRCHSDRAERGRMRRGNVRGVHSKIMAALGAYVARLLL